FAPPLTTAFHTLLAGTAPGFTMTAEFYGLQPEQMELRLQNAQIDLSQLQPGSLLGLVKLYYSSSIYGFQQLIVKEVGVGRVAFELLALEEGDGETGSTGELIQAPPTVVMNILDQIPASIMPTTVDEEIIFSDGIFRLPANGGEKFSMTTTFTSVSSRKD